LKKEQAAEADVTLSGVEDTEVLMAFYENNTFQDKFWIFDSVIRFMYVLKKSCSTP